MRKLFLLFYFQKRKLAEKYFTPARGYTSSDIPFYKYFTPSRGSQFIQTSILPKEAL